MNFDLLSRGLGSSKGWKFLSKIVQHFENRDVQKCAHMEPISDSHYTVINTWYKPTQKRDYKKQNKERK